MFSFDIPHKEDSETMEIFRRLFLEKKGLREFFSFENIPGCRVENAILPDSKDIDAMSSIYKKNLYSSPYSIQERLLQKLQQNAENKESEFLLLHFQDTLCGFSCFTPIQNHKNEPVFSGIFNSAVNIHPSCQGIGVGANLFYPDFQKRFQEKKIFLDCISFHTSSAKLIEWGFIGYRYWIDDTEPVLDLVGTQENKELFSSKRMSENELIQKYQENSLSKDLHILSTSELPTVDFSPCNSGFVLTRSFFSKPHSLWFFVFEKTPLLFPKRSVG